MRVTALTLVYMHYLGTEETASSSLNVPLLLRSLGC